MPEPAVVGGHPQAGAKSAAGRQGMRSDRRGVADAGPERVPARSAPFESRGVSGPKVWNAAARTRTSPPVRPCLGQRPCGAR